MNEWKIKVSRSMLGLFALSCLAGGAVLWFRESENSYGSVASALMNVGVLLGTVWIAFPGGANGRGYIEVTPKGLVIALIAIFAVVMRPRIVVPGLLILLVLWFVLRPRNRTINRRR
ncbi:MAG: hypothetical protein Tsb009_12510 [Planctomycetaceae bacterium]